MVDVEIYVSNLIKFFKNNPNDLITLIPEEKKDDFFSKIKEVVIENYDNGRELELTKSQLIDICVDINRKFQQAKAENNIVQETKFGKIYLN